MEVPWREGLTIVEIGMFPDIEIIIYFELFLPSCIHIMTDIEIEITIVLYRVLCKRCVYTFDILSYIYIANYSFNCILFHNSITTIWIARLFIFVF